MAELIIIIILSIVCIYLFISRRRLKKVLLSRPVRTLNPRERLNFTTEFLDMITTLINIEIVNHKRFQLLLGQETKNIDYDKTIKEVATAVFEAIKKEFFLENDHILTETYLMSFIQKNTTLVYLQFLNEHGVDTNEE